ncbi:hypothetical protein QE152_g36605 [Popillia japonica]|uniref:Uncharacterized protein n=1 Tax=Popillia japonica TaxID=7064 RepID=A0AAW1ICJ1_POPJA
MIRSRGLLHRQFQQFLESVHAEHSDILYYSKVRWLSAGKDIWVCDMCGEELIIGEEGNHICFDNAPQLYQVGDTNRLTNNSCITPSVAGKSVESVDPNEIIISAVERRPGLYNHKLPLQ